MDISGSELNLTYTLPLTTSTFNIGECKNYIDSIEPGIRKDLMLAEYYQLTARYRDTLDIVSKYLHNEDICVRGTAMVLYIFSSISLGNMNDIKKYIGYAKEFKTLCYKDDELKKDRRLNAQCILIINLIYISLHLEMDDTSDLMEEIKHLEGGLKRMATYIVCHKYYLRGEYNRAIGMIEGILNYEDKDYPVIDNYLHLLICVNHMSEDKINQAEKYYEKIYKQFQKEFFIHIYVEHYMLLRGLMERYMRQSNAELYNKIAKLANKFLKNWVKVHNSITNDKIADNLTSMEYIVAMLYKSNWTVNKISRYIGISDNTVKKHIKSIYYKLGINKKSELALHITN